MDVYIENPFPKKIRDKETRNKLSMSKFMSEIDNLGRLIRGPLMDHKIGIVNNIKYENVVDAAGSEVLLSFKDLEMRDVVTPEEQIILSLLDLIDGNYEDGKLYPFGHPEERYEIAHLLSREELWNKFSGYSKSDLDAGHRFAIKFSKQFYKLAERKKKTTFDPIIQSSEVKLKRTEYDEDMFNLVKLWIPEFNKLTPNARKASTIAIISGLDFRKNIKYLPPIEVMDKSIYKKYMEVWEDNFIREEDGVPVSMKFEKDSSVLNLLRGNRLPLASIIKNRRC